jgi:signal transduction histidine kinase
MAWLALRPHSLTNKLTILTAFSSGVVLMLSCAAFVVNDVAMLRAWKAQELRETTEMLATASSEALSQSNPRPVRNLLLPFHHRQQIYAVYVFDARGDSFASFERVERAGAKVVRPSYTGHQFTSDGFLDVCLPVRAGTEEVGSIYMRATIGDLTNQITRYISIALGVMFASFLLAILICGQMQRFISSPILGLAQTIKRVTNEGDYSIRVRRPSDDEIGELYDAFNEMLVRIDTSDAALHRAHEELCHANNQLESRVQQRTEELSHANQQLIEASRKAGMAEVANGVLHNVGNVLNSVNVSTSLIHETVRNSEVNDLSQVVDILDEHRDDIIRFFAEDPRADHVCVYLKEASQALTHENELLLTRVESLNRHVEHIKAVVSTQQSFAGTSGVEQVVSVAQLIDDAVEIHIAALSRDKIVVRRSFEELPPLSIDKQKVLQILINLIGNAHQAICESGRDRGEIRLVVAADGDDWIKLQVTDNGIGIDEENIQKVFRHGFTTKADGHGFGLHSAALAAGEVGGALAVSSGGVGLGATFTLRLPRKHEALV